jgi:hypothetical protein
VRVNLYFLVIVIRDRCTNIRRKNIPEPSSSSKKRSHSPSTSESDSSSESESDDESRASSSKKQKSKKEKKREKKEKKREKREKKRGKQSSREKKEDSEEESGEEVTILDTVAEQTLSTSRVMTWNKLPLKDSTRLNLTEYRSHYDESIEQIVSVSHLFLQSVTCLMLHFY